MLRSYGFNYCFCRVSSTSNFFYGVTALPTQTGAMYCSCVKGRESLCSPGMGVMKCSISSKDLKKKSCIFFKTHRYPCFVKSIIINDRKLDTFVT